MHTSTACHAYTHLVYIHTLKTSALCCCSLCRTDTPLAHTHAHTHAHKHSMPCLHTFGLHTYPQDVSTVLLFTVQDRHPSCTCTCTYTCIQAHKSDVHTHTHTCTCTYTCTYTHMHTCTQAHKYCVHTYSQDVSTVRRVMKTHMHTSTQIWSTYMFSGCQHCAARDGDAAHVVGPQQSVGQKRVGRGRSAL